MRKNRLLPLLIALLTLSSVLFIGCTCEAPMHSAHTASLADIVSSADDANSEENTIIEYPVLLAGGSVIVEQNDERILFHGGQLAGLTEHDVAIINSIPQRHSLTVLSASSDDMLRLREIDGLRRLHLDFSHELDFSSLASLKHLEYLELSACSTVADLSFVSRCKALTAFKVYDCYSINDYSILTLAEADGLKELELQHLYRVSNLEPLSRMTGLEKFVLSDASQINDLSFLSSLTNAKTLYLCNIGITDISFLSSLTNLERLEIAHCIHGDISDISPLSKLKKLKYLYLSNLSTDDISVLPELTGLEELFISDTILNDISPLYELLSLKQLTLLDCCLSENAKDRLASELPDCELITEALG